MNANSHRQSLSKLRSYAGLGDRIFLFAIYALLALSGLVILLPIINVIASSFSNPREIQAGNVLLWPVKFTLMGYETVLKSKHIITGFKNSVIYASLGTAYTIFMNILAAYPLSRKDLPGRRWIAFLFTLTMFVGGGLIPSYLWNMRLGLVNTRWVMIIGGVSAWSVMIMRTFFNLNIPDELLQATQIDGCNDFQFVTRFVLSLAKPIIFVQVLQSVVGSWNGYFGAMIYLNERELFPLQVILRNILILSDTPTDITKMLQQTALEEQKYMSYVLKYSLIVISSVPMLMLYPFVQKYFVKGMLIGSLKM